MKTSPLLFALLPQIALAAEPILGAEPNTIAVSTAWGVVHVEKITVKPDNEDLPPPEKSRWVKFEEALGPRRTYGYRTYQWRNNDGTRVECYSPCYNNCCVESGGFSLLGAGFGK